MLTFVEFRRIRKTYIDHESTLKCKKAYKMYKKRFKKKLEMLVGNACTTAYVDCPQFSFADCPAPQPPAMDWYGEPKQEGINPMNYATATVQAATTETQDQRKYLERRLSEVYNDKRDPLESLFGLVDDDAPANVTELKERLEKGQYSFRTGDQYRYWHWTDLIQWRSPDRKADHDGFKAALDELKALRQKSLDIIKIEEPKAGLDAVKALEAWEPKGAAN